jgi:hypothetical protein
MVEIGPEARLTHLVALLDRMQADLEQSRHLAVLSWATRVDPEAQWKQKPLATSAPS